MLPTKAVQPAESTGHYRTLQEGAELRRQVWGYLPYWETEAEVQWDLLTHLLYFVVEIDASGLVKERRGWGSATVQRIVDDARAAGVEVILTVSNFNDDEIDLILQDPARRSAMIHTCIELLAEHDADGINVDFEFVPLSSRDAFVSFMTDLKGAVVQGVSEGRSGHVSIAGPSVDWEGAYDYDALLSATDGIMIMAYGYHWPGGDPGPTSPLYGGGAWSELSIDWTVSDYLLWGGEENRGRVILGLPWYGHLWPVQSTAVPTTASGQGVSASFSEILPDALIHDVTLEPLTRSLYFHKEEAGQLWQVWYEDAPAFAERLDYVEQRDIGGIGIWALGYEGTQTAYWDTIRTAWLAPASGPDERHPEAADILVADDVAESVDDASGPEPDAESPDNQRERSDRPADNPAAPAAATVSQQGSTRLVVRKGCATGPATGFWGWLFALALLSFRRARRVPSP